jgi:hypothetical protein
MRDHARWLRCIYTIAGAIVCPGIVRFSACPALLAAATANKKTVDADAVQQALLDQEAS